MNKTIHKITKFYSHFQLESKWKGAESENSLYIIDQHYQSQVTHDKLCLLLNFQTSRTLKISQQKWKNISQYYHTSLQGNLMNFYPSPKCYKKIILGNLKPFERSKIFTPQPPPAKFVLSKFTPL